MQTERRAAFKPGDGVAIYGIRRGGKTTLAKRLVAAAAYDLVMTVDPVDGWSGSMPGPRCDSMEGVQNAMNAGAPVVHVVTSPREIGRAADMAAHMLFQRMRKVTIARRDGELPDGEGPRALLLLDEANWIIGAGREGACPHVVQAILQGRHSNIDFCLITQRPALISKSLRAQAALQVAFHLEDDDDRKAVSGKIGKGAADAFRTLPEFHAICTERGQSWIEPGS